MEKYRVYKNFVEQGFKLLNKEAIRKFHSIKTENCKRKSSNNNKRKLTDSNDSEVPVKLTIKNTVDDKIEGFKTNFESRTEEDFLEVLEKFREEGPKLNSSYDSVQQPDYFGFFPISRCKQNHDFNLYIRYLILISKFHLLFINFFFAEKSVIRLILITTNIFLMYLLFIIMTI